MKFITVNDLPLHYEYLDLRHDRTFLFVNSLGTDFRIWDAVAQGLAPHGNILRFDKMGHGLSGFSQKKYRIGDYGRDVLALMDALNIGKVVLTGLSIGGIIGQWLGVNHPERLEKLVLSNTAPKIGTDQSWNTRIDQVRAEGIKSVADAVMKMWFSPHFHEQRAPELQAYRSMLSNSPPDGYIAACEAIRDNDLSAQIGRIRLPALVFAGSADGSTPPDLVRAMAEKISGARFVLLEGAGHIPCVEKPEEMTAAILDFVNDQGHPDAGGMASDRYATGMKIRRSVLTDHYVDRAEATKTNFNADFQKFIVETAWGEIWSRPGLARRERSLITISVLATLGHWDEFEIHLQGARNNGATVEEIKETLMHIAIYAGVPVANHAFRVAKKVFDE